jgi:endonuclease YncB( thermonuclease family)
MSLVKKPNQILFNFLLFFFFTLSNSAFSETKIISYNASEVIVTDGDSLRFGKEKIRLFGIDAPEIKQICKNKFEKFYACGEDSKKSLESWILFAAELKKKIYCYYSERDKYNRILGECFIGETKHININKLMVFFGDAISYLRYSDKYLAEQKNAKVTKRGLWQGYFDMPEEWRIKNK